jgi:hypothetical protein
MLIGACGILAIVLGYLLSRMRGNWGSSAWAVLLLFILSGMGFLVTVLLFYMRPQYGARAFPFLLAFFLGHAALVMVLWRIGVFGR